jgi:hypothetical protein
MACKASRALENVRGLVARDRKKIPAEIVEHLLRFCAEGGVASNPLRPVKLEHLTDGHPCWCDPEVRPDGVVIHREAQ